MMVTFGVCGVHHHLCVYNYSANEFAMKVDFANLSALWVGHLFWEQYHRGAIMPCLVLKSTATSWKLCFCVQFFQIVFWFTVLSRPLVDAFLNGCGDPAEVGLKVGRQPFVVLCQGMGCMW